MFRLCYLMMPDTYERNSDKFRLLRVDLLGCYIYVVDKYPVLYTGQF